MQILLNTFLWILSSCFGYLLGFAISKIGLHIIKKVRERKRRKELIKRLEFLKTLNFEDRRKVEL